MRAVKDKATGMWKLGPNCSELYETKEQCQRAGLDKLTERLAYIRKKYSEGVLNYGK